MRAYEVRAPFGVDALTPVERPVPAPGAGQVLLRMRAVSLNYRDRMIVDGVWRPTAPRVPASDGVGEVVAVGDGVARVAVGDRVAPIFLPRWLDGELTPEKRHGPLGGVAADGVLAEYVVVGEEAVVHVPAHLTDEEAATLPCAAVTAWHAVVRRGAVRAGDVVVVQGTGTVSLFALQFARLHGAHVVVTSSSDDRIARAVELGALHGVNYAAAPDWDRRVLDITGGRGADLVLDAVGGDNLRRSLNAVRLSGAVAFIGLLGGTIGRIETFELVEKNVRLHGIHVGSRAMFEEMNRALATHRLRPVVERCFRFEEAPAALRYLAGGSRFGKVCVRL